jgi:hypothetical protein
VFSINGDVELGHDIPRYTPTPSGVDWPVCAR